MFVVEEAEITAAPDWSLSIRRPMMEMDLAPALANATATALPIPVPPPVMTMFLPEAESSGRVGDMKG